MAEKGLIKYTTARINELLKKIDDLCIEDTLVDTLNPIASSVVYALSLKLGKEINNIKNNYVTKVDLEKILSLFQPGGGNVRLDVEQWFTELQHFDKGIQIGKGILKWDELRSAYYLSREDGKTCNFYATGDIAAYGISKDEETSGGVSTLGELNNVDDSADLISTDTDYIIYKPKNSTHWILKDLAKITGLDERALNEYLTRYHYATLSWVESQQYARQLDLKKLKELVETIQLDVLKKLNKGTFTRLFTAVDKTGLEINIDDVESSSEIFAIKARYNLFSLGDVTAYGESELEDTKISTLGSLFNVDSIVDSNSNKDVLLIRKANTSHWTSANLNDIVKLDTNALDLYLRLNNYAKKSDIPSLESYATKLWVLDKDYATNSVVGNLLLELKTVSDKLTNFLEGSDTDTIINKWKELEAFLAGQKEGSTLADLLSLKLDKEVFDDLFEKVQVLNKWSIKAKYPLWSTGDIAAYGESEGGEGGDSNGYILFVTELPQDTKPNILYVLI